MSVKLEVSICKEAEYASCPSAGTKSSVFPPSAVQVNTNDCGRSWIESAVVSPCPFPNVITKSPLAVL